MLSVMGMVAASALTMGGQAAPAVNQDPLAVAPRGSYARTCSGDYVNQGRLYADCRDNRGQIRGTSIRLNLCTQHDIANDNGRLVCGPNRGDYEERRGNDRGNDRWGDRGDRRGWGRAEITVYRDSGFRGASTTFTGEMANLDHTGFNDQISSMRFRGEWEACTDAYFRGYCQRFEGDVSNLDRWGMNDRISSLRPVGRGSRW